MWKRDEAVKPASGHATPTVPFAQLQPSGAPVVPQSGARPLVGKDLASIGKSVCIKGDLVGQEDLTIEGQFDGKIELKDHVLTIGLNGKIKAQIVARVLVVFGEVNGNITAIEKVDIRDGGSIDGDIVSPRVAIAEDAHFRGSVDMQRKAKSPGQAETPLWPAAQPVLQGPVTPPAAHLLPR